MLVKNGGPDKVQTVDDYLKSHGEDVGLDHFDGRIALLESKDGATENVYETKYHHVCQILNHRVKDGDHQ